MSFHLLLHAAFHVSLRASWIKALTLDQVLSPFVSTSVFPYAPLKINLSATWCKPRRFYLHSGLAFVLRCLNFITWNNNAAAEYFIHVKSNALGGGGGKCETFIKQISKVCSEVQYVESPCACVCVLCWDYVGSWGLVFMTHDENTPTLSYSVEL